MDPDPLDDLPPDSRRGVVEQVCDILDVDVAIAEDIVRSSEPFWDAMERAGGLVDTWGGGEFCDVLPRVLSFIRDEDVAAVSRDVQNDDILFINVITGTDENQERWAALAMGLSRRSTEQQESEPLTSPFALGVGFLAKGRYVEPDFEGVKVGRFSRRHNLLEVSATLPETLPGDPLTEIISVLHQAVDEARAYARKKKIADDLPSLRRAVERLAAAGPAPVRRPKAPERPLWANDTEAPYLRLTASSGKVEIDPSEDLLVSYLDLLDDEDAFLHLERLSSDRGGSLRVSRAGRFVQIDRKESPMSPLYIARTRDLDLAAHVLVAWTFEHEPLPTRILWQHVEG